MNKLLAAILTTVLTVCISMDISYAAPSSTEHSRKNPAKRQGQVTKANPSPTQRRPAATVAKPTPRQDKPSASTTERRPARPQRPAATVAKPTPQQDKPSASNADRRPTRPQRPTDNAASQPEKTTGSTNSPRPLRPTTSAHIDRENMPDRSKDTRPSLDTDRQRPSINQTRYSHRPAPPPKNHQRREHRPLKIHINKVSVVSLPVIGIHHVRPSRYYLSRPGYVKHNNYIVYNNIIIARPNHISYVYHPVVYHRPLPRHYRPHYYLRYHDYYRGYSDFYILGRLLLAFANAAERSDQQQQIDSLRDEISYLQHKLELQDEQLTTNNQDEFYQLLETLGVSQDEVDSYDIERDYLLTGGA